MATTRSNKTILLTLGCATALCVSARLVLSRGAASPSAAATYDVVISHGRVMDPESGLDALKNVGIRAGKIAAISSDALSGTRVIDASNLVVSPGFIDLHEHGQDEKNYEFQARDGVTTSLELEVGTLNVADWYAHRDGKALINYGVAIGQIPARMQVMHDPGALLPTGPAAHREATPDEIAQMSRIIDEGFKQGALGLGMGINYTAAASHQEIFQMFQLAAKHAASVHVHMRFLGAKEPNNGMAALDEVLADAAASGAPLHVVHITSMGLKIAPQLIAMVAAAQHRGLDVTTECYPYTAGSTDISSAIFDGDWQERTGMAYSDLQWTKTGERLTAETFDRYRKEGGLVVMFMIPEPIVREAVANPMIMIASDGMMISGPKIHPRGQGTYARVLGHYVREEKALDLMTALRKMTLMPAQRLEKRAPVFKQKGRLRVGADADITVFDPNRVIDKATFDEPLQYSEGIPFVLVNGVVVVNQSSLVQGVLPGKPQRAPVNQ
jgi:dihydroorotase